MSVVLTLSGVPHVIIVSCPSYTSPGVLPCQPLVGLTLKMLSSHWLCLCDNLQLSVQVLVTQPLNIRCLTPSKLSVVYTNVTWPLIGIWVLTQHLDWSDAFRQTCFCTRLSPHSFLESSSETQELERQMTVKYWQTLTNQRPVRWEQ